MIAGGCLCGAVRIKVDAEPIAVRTCWCRDCQYLAAGSATVNVVFPTDNVRIDGDIRYFESKADSGNLMRRGFCPSCGTALTSVAKSRPHLLIVRVGALDEPERFAPQLTIWTDSAPGWAPIDAGLPSTERQPPPAG